MRSSDLYRCTSQPPVTFLEGMPGAGKTTLLTALADAGHTVLGEYTSTAGTTVALADQQLLADRLALPDRWIVLDMSPAVSLARRHRTLDPAHPWSAPGNLRRLRDLYRDPSKAIAPTHQPLATLMAAVPRTVVDATTSLAALMATVTATAAGALR